MTYEVIYRQGGTHHCIWRRVSERYKDRGEALASTKNLVRMGYKALVRTTKELDTIGLPVGWKFDAVDWESDEVTVTPYETVHIKRSQPMWYEVRMHVDDIPWVYNFKDQAYRKARLTAERTGYPALVYECSEYGEKLIAAME